MKRPSDLAISSDSGMLFVADTTDNVVTAIDTTTGQIVWSKETSADTVSLAATGAAAEREAWSAARDVARRFDGNGATAEVNYKANVLDGAFTSDGERYYVTSDATDLRPEEVVVMTRAGTQELARLPSAGRLAASPLSRRDCAR